MPRQNAINFPTRRVGALMFFGGNIPSGVSQSGFFLDYDGYWVTCSENVFRTIGSPSSGASIAQTWLFNLFDYLWSTYNATDAPILTSAGASTAKGTSALNDWNANRRLTFPDYRGRALIAVGQGNGLTSRLVGQFMGAETHTLTIEQIPSHAHPNSTLTLTGTNRIGFQSGGSYLENSGNTGTNGSGQAHNNMQPSISLPLFISAGSR